MAGSRFCFKRSGNRPAVGVIFAAVKKTPLTFSLETARPLPRRAFLRYVGASAAAGSLLLAGCKGDDPDSPTPENPTGATVSLGGTLDVALLNLLQAGKQITTALYQKLLTPPPAWLTGADLALVQTIAAHAAVHRDFLKAAVNSLRTAAANPAYALADLPTDLTSINFADRTAPLTAALTLENILVSTATGAARYGTRESVTTLLGQLVSVGGRHAATLAALLPAASIADPQELPIDARNLTRRPSEAIAALNPYLAFGSRLLSSGLA